MFDDVENQASGGTGAADYGCTVPVRPGAVDPARAAALAEAIEDGVVVWDPAEEALFGPDPQVDVRALFAALDAESGGAPAADVPAGVPTGVPEGVVDPRRLVPQRMPSVEDMPPGPGLARLLDAADLSGVGASELVETIAGWQRIGWWAAAQQAAAIIELSRRVEMQPVQDGRQVETVSRLRITAAEVAARLALTASEGERLAARARVWCTELPAGWAALERGRIDVRKAEVIADTLRGHTPELARRVAAEVLEHAERMTAPRLRRGIVRALHRLDPATMAAKAQHAMDNRDVRFTPARDGMAWSEAYLPAEDAAALQTAIEAAAAAINRADPGDGRTVSQRRADALAQLGWLALATGRLGGCGCGQWLDSQHRRPVAAQLTVPIGVLLGLDQRTPAELAGHGPIPAEVARRLAAHGTRRRLLTDPVSGTVLDHGRTRYQPPPDLVQHVHARDQRCRFPGCDKPAAGCDVDHTTPFPDGPTAAANLGPFCAPHHIGKHHNRWTANQPEPGRFEFTSPTAHSHTVTPEPLHPTPFLDQEHNDHPDPPNKTHPHPPHPANPLQTADHTPPF
jgi:hypothetical protein